MELSRIVDEIASQTDDFLDGATNRKEARAGIYEQINANYPHLNPAERKQVAEDVMLILGNEGFFESERSGRATGESDENTANGD